ncbi:TetR/AcrR family transcriptional regulator [Brevibacillus sp. B_LB10_24]|uniref:TetR/AcrR family transcriptional regulator n=1 Tax=Brevibacillus sp. B_LB10_24 TaxID=3380645 RepID=UPI0038BD6B4D
MAPLNDEQLHLIRDERREQILLAALRVFAARGIVGTKMSMIASEAGISHGLLYHYFKSKDELFTTLVEGAMAAADDEMRRVADLPGSPIEKIKGLTQAILDESGSPFFMLIHQARISDGVPEKVNQLLEDYSMKTFVEQLLPIFLEGQKTGEIAADNPEELIASYLTVLTSLMVVNTHGDEGYLIPSVDILLRMVACPK